MGIFKASAAQEPRTVTPGQKTVRSHGDFGFQTSFVGLDWVEMSFNPERGDAMPWEASTDDDLLLRGGDWAIAPENRGSGNVFQERLMSHEYTTLMIDRTRLLRDKTQMAVSMAIQCDFGDWIDTQGGHNDYQRHLKGPEGARIDYDRRGSGVAGDGFYFHVTLPGKAARLMDEDRGRKLLQYADSNGGKATRIDMAMDDYERVLSVDEIDAATSTEDFVSRTERVLVMKSHAPRSTETTGQTLYIGKTKSRRICRIYDKLLEDGEHDCIRWEMEEKKSAAEELLKQLIARDPVTNKPRPWSDVAKERLLSFLDFRDAGSHSEVERRERCKWFALLVRNLSRAKVYPASTPKTLDEVKDWIEKQIGPSLRVVVLAAGGSLEEVYGWIERAKVRMRPRHMALLASSSQA